MTVADLQQHLADLVSLLERAGCGKAVTTDLGAIHDGLQPFRGLPLRGFADFLRRAEAYSRGEVPITPPKSASKPRAPKAPPKPKADPQALAREVQDLYGRAGSPDVTSEQVRELAGRLQVLGKNDLLAVAAVIDLKLPKSTSKGKALDAIRQRILGRKGGTVRVGLLDKQQHGSPPHAATEGTHAGGPPPTPGAPHVPATPIHPQG